MQCSQYATAIIAPQLAERIEPAWLGQPLKAVFLRVDQRGMREHIWQHAAAAVRLYGPANVGFAYVTQHKRPESQHRRGSLVVRAMGIPRQRDGPHRARGQR